MTSANVVDSSGWLEYFIDSKRAPLFAPAIEDTTNLLVPVIVLYEVFNPNTEVGGTAFAASIGRTSRQEIWDSIDLIQPLRSPTSCAAKPGTAYGTSNFGIRV